MVLPLQYSNPFMAAEVWESIVCGQSLSVRNQYHVTSFQELELTWLGLLTNRQLSSLSPRKPPAVVSYCQTN